MSTGKEEATTLSPAERQSIILEKINVAGRVTAVDLAQEFNVSEDSIRRDLRELVDAGVVQRFHGGAARLVTPALDFHRRETLGTEEKQRIGRAAAAAMPEGATLLVDTSTTVVQFIRQLPPTLSVRIFTSSVDVAGAGLDHPLAEVTLLGGRLSKFTRSATGASAIEAVRGLKVDFCVLGTCGIDDDLTLRADDLEDAFFKKAMIKASNKTLVLASSDKLGQVATHEVAPISVVSQLFTTSQDSSFLERVREMGVDVQTA